MATLYPPRKNKNYYQKTKTGPRSDENGVTWKKINVTHNKKK